MTLYREHELTLIESLRKEIAELEKKIQTLESKFIWHQEVTVVYGEACAPVENQKPRTRIKIDLIEGYSWLVKRDKVPVGGKVILALLEPSNENYSSNKVEIKK